MERDCKIVGTEKYDSDLEKNTILKISRLLFLVNTYFYFFKLNLSYSQLFIQFNIN